MMSGSGNNSEAAPNSAKQAETEMNPLREIASVMMVSLVILIDEQFVRWKWMNYIFESVYLVLSIRLINPDWN